MGKQLLFTKQLKHFFAQHSEIDAAYLFGSWAKEQPTRLSDVDLALLLKEPYHLPDLFDYQLKMMAECSLIVKHEADVIIFNTAPPFLKYQILSKGRKIYERRDRVNHALELRAWCEYFDFRPMKNRIEQTMLKRLRQEHGR